MLQITILNQQYADLLAKLNALIAQLNGGVNQWTVMAPMPIPVEHFNAIAIGKLIYIIGGGGLSAVTNQVQVYNTVTNTWSSAKNMPTARGEQGSAVVNGIIYVIGGYGNTALNVVEAYNPATDTWTTKAPLNTARSVFSVAVINNKIYAIGGWPGNMNTVEVYNPTTNTWTYAASLPFGHHQNNGAVGYNANGKIYFIGGKNDLVTNFYDNNECYDSILNTWTEKAPNLMKVFDGSTALDTSAGLIHYVGGVTIPRYINTYTSGQVNSHYIYNIASDSWSVSTPLPVNIVGHASVFLDGKLYVFGGFDANGIPQNTVYRYY
jgi:N-acetylneuraminic acid mutarotase